MTVRDTDRTDPSRDRSLEVPCEVLAVTLVRQRLAEHLADQGCSQQLVRDAAIVVSELLMNAIVHGEADAAGHVHVGWSLDETGLDVRVRDSGSAGLPHLELADDDAAGGRGLQLVELLTERWWVETDGGTEVRARLLRERSTECP